MRQFESGATRNVDIDSQDYEGFLSPLVISRFGEYMHKHRRQADGQLRASDNWQKGIPLHSYMKSGWRHFLDWWMAHRGFESREGLEEGLCALLFNAQGYLHETLKARGYKQCPLQVEIKTPPKATLSTLQEAGNRLSSASDAEYGQMKLFDVETVAQNALSTNEIDGLVKAAGRL
jgi:hypothetical protein